MIILAMNSFSMLIKNNLKTGNIRNLIANIDRQYTTGSLVAHNPDG
jgi:hypothetical protein